MVDEKKVSKKTVKSEEKQKVSKKKPRLSSNTLGVIKVTPPRSNFSKVKGILVS